jgi:hypothetical protein
MMTRILGRFSVAAACGMVALALSATAAQAQSEQDFTLVNGTEYVIDEVYVAPNTGKTWGPDIMGDGVLDAGASKLVKFRSGTTHCLYNMKVKWADGTNSEWSKDFDLCTISKITLRYNKSTDVTTAITE